MAQPRIFHDRDGQTLTIWFGVPGDERVCHEIGDEVVLMKDRSGRVIGFEKLNFAPPASEHSWTGHSMLCSRTIARRLEQAVGPTTIEVDGFLSLNVQLSDLHILQWRHRLVVLISERLRQASRVVPWLTTLADSLYVRSVRKSR